MLEATLGLASIVRTAQITALNHDFPVHVPFTMTAAKVPARLTRAYLTGVTRTAAAWTVVPAGP